MVSDKVTLKFEIDATQWNQVMGQVNKGLTDFQSKAAVVTPNITRMSGEMNKLEKQTVTTAVRFQTLTMGAINLTTAFAQTYTSFSNIQRANTSMAQAIVSTERAEDALLRKKYKLNQAMKQEIPDLEKIALLKNEVATATDQLAVAEQKQKDEADRLKDTQILLATNILNVGFSAVQTAGSMYQMVKSAGDVTKSVKDVAGGVGILSKALSFLQAHPVFVVLSLAFLAWELGISKIIQGLTGADYSVSHLLATATGLNDVKDSTQILGHEFKSASKDIDDMGTTMTATSSSMVGSITKVHDAMKVMEHDFSGISKNTEKLGLLGMGLADKYVTALDAIKLEHTAQKEIATDLNMLLDSNYNIATAMHLINQDIMGDYRRQFDYIMAEYNANRLNREEKEKLLDILDSQTFQMKQQLSITKDMVLAERALKNEKKTKNKDWISPFKSMAEIKADFYFKRKGIDPESQRAQMYVKYGVDIGETGNVFSGNDANRIAETERYLGKFANTKGGYGTALVAYLGGSATNAFQADGKINIDPIFKEQRLKKDKFANTGGYVIYQWITQMTNNPQRVGGLSRSAADNWNKNWGGASINISLFHKMVAWGIRDDEESQEALADILNGGHDNDVRTINSMMSRAVQVAKKYEQKMERMMSGIGVDMNIGNRQFTSRTYGKRRHKFVDFKEHGTALDDFVADLGISKGIKFAWGTDLIQMLARFGGQTRLSNFNNKDVTQRAIDRLHLSEQEAWDIRFDATRGDDEIDDRIRFKERMLAMSTGATSI